MSAWRYDFYLLVLKISHSFAALTREIFSTLEDKICISAWPCNILYIYTHECKDNLTNTASFYIKIYLYFLIILTKICSILSDFSNSMTLSILKGDLLKKHPNLLKSYLCTFWQIIVSIILQLGI